VSDFIDEIMKVVTDNAIPYRGVFIYPYRGKWRVYDKEADTLEGAKKIIDDSYKWVEESLKK
jgi:hypothetical protein